MNLDYDQLLALTTSYGMPILKALAILVVGWGVAKIVSMGTKKLLDKTDIDNKLAAKLTGGRAAGVAIEAGVGRLVYWLIMLFVLMAVFQALGLTVVTEPINVLLTKIAGFLPQALAAGVLAAIAWAVATVLRVVVANLLGAFQVDKKLGDQAGQEMKKVSLTSTLADAVYYLIWLLFLPQIIDALQMEGLSPVKDMVGQILGFLPSLFGALIVFFLFYVVARVVQRLATNLLGSVGFDRLPEHLGLGAARGGAGSASAIAGYVILTILLFLGGVQAFRTLGLEAVSSLAEQLLEGLFNIVVAVVIFGVGLFLSRVAYQAISPTPNSQTAFLGNIARAAILIFTGAMALFRAGLASQIVTLAFGAVIVGLALAAALAFGLGGREEAARTISAWRSRS
jgi:Mechanosensitive ion channel, conserved TM helix